MRKQIPCAGKDIKKHIADCQINYYNLNHSGYRKSGIAFIVLAEIPNEEGMEQRMAGIKNLAGILVNLSPYIVIADSRIETNHGNYM